jgi:hypothetical protein
MYVHPLRVAHDTNHVYDHQCELVLRGIRARLTAFEHSPASVNMPPRATLDTQEEDSRCAIAPGQFVQLHRR